MKKHLILLLLLAFGCAGTQNLFTSLPPATEDDYGYSENNPILIGQYSSWQQNTDLALYYLTKLSKDGKPLKMAGHATLRKPEDQPRKPRSPFTSMYGVPSNMGGEYLDLYIVVPKGTTDTFNLIFDVEIKGELKIPAGLHFDTDQQNNIYL